MLSRVVLISATASLIALSGCQENLNLVGSVNEKTNYKYDEAGYMPKSYEQPTAPGLVFIEGGTFHMGGAEKDIAYEMNNRERQVTVHSFYMDRTEIANVDWKMFLHFVGQDSGEEKAKALYPDTSVWFRELAYNEPFVELYYQNPAFNTYPVVGVNWYQANEYCKWRTEFVHQRQLEEDPEATLFPKYRLPTEGEWEYAARGLLEQELYTWEGRSLRNVKGRFIANFKRGRGDYAGRSDKGGSLLVEGLNDGYMIPAPVNAFPPNDFGLQNMAGNVSEWTFDTYRVLAFEDNEDFQPYRRRGEAKDPRQIDTDYSRDGKGTLSLLFNPGNDPTEDHDRVKVYRGGSWNDVAYYLSAGTRRFFNADSSASFIGFRCAMIRVGSPSLDY